MVPPAFHPKWKDLVTGKKSYNFSSLSTKIMLGRVLNSVKQDNTNGNLEKRIAEVHSYFSANEQRLQSEIKMIFE